MTRHPFSAAADRGPTSLDSHLVYEVFLLHLRAMNQNWVEFFAVCPTAPRMPRLCCRTHHFRMVFFCRLPLPLRAAARRSRRHDSFDMNSLVVPPLEQATVVPSLPQARSLSRNSQFQSFTSTRNVSLRRQTSRHCPTARPDVRIVHQPCQHRACSEQCGVFLSQTRNENCHSSASCSSLTAASGALFAPSLIT